MKKRLFLFDFDGTITTRDSFILLIRKTFGEAAFVKGFARNSIFILLMKLGLYDTQKCKERIFSFFFRDLTKQEFEAICYKFHIEYLDAIIRPSFKKYFKEIKNKYPNDDYAVVSASIKDWLCYWSSSMEMDLISTEIEIVDAKVTGVFLTKNCNGEEKVKRIKKHYDLLDYDLIYVYGNSKGDKQLLDIADKKFYKFFK